MDGIHPGISATPLASSSAPILRRISSRPGALLRPFQTVKNATVESTRMYTRRDMDEGNVRSQCTDSRTARSSRALMCSGVRQATLRIVDQRVVTTSA